MGKILNFAFQLDVAVSGGGFKNLQLLGSQFEKLRQAGEKLSNQQKLISGFQDTQRRIDSLNSSLPALRQKYSDNDTQLVASRKRLQTLSEQYKAAQARSQSLEKTMPKNSMLATFAKKRSQELEREYKAAAKGVKELEREQAKLEQQITKSEHSLGAESTRLQEMGAALSQAGINTDNLAERQAKLAQASQKLESAQKRLASIKSQLTWDNFKMDVLKSAAIIGMFKQPVQVTMNFDQAMAQVRAVKAMTDEEFTSLETQAKDLGASTQFSATQAANTQENLARAGMSIRDILAALPAVLSMAGAEGMDLAQAGSIIAKGLGGMGLEGNFAGRLADVLAYTSSSSNTNIAEIGDAFKVVAPVLSKQGATMEQIASYIGVMANKGYTGSEAGNALASTTMRLANLPKKARDKLLNIGLDSRMFKTKEGRMVELPEIMKMIDSAMKAKNLGEFEQLDILSEVFGKSQGKAMSAFMSASAAGDADIMQNGVYNDSFGKAAEMNRTRNNTLKGDITSLSSAWEGLMIAIGQPLDAVNRSVVQVVTELLSKTTKFINENKDLMRIVLRLGYIFGGMKILGTVYKYGKLLVQLPFAKLAVWSAAANAEAVAAGTSVGLVGKVLGGLLHPITTLKAGFSGLWSLALAHPFGAILAAGLGLLILIAKWDDLKAWWNSWTINDVWAMLPEWAQKDLEKCKKFFTDIYDWIEEKFSKLNPFNWELPSWLGGGRAGDNQVRNAEAAIQGYQPPSIAPARRNLPPVFTNSSPSGKTYGAQAHAVGGIFSRPHIGLVAEAGPEAIVPLRNKSRGIEILSEAAGILGLPRIGLPDMGLPRLRLPKFPEIFRNTNSPVSILSGMGGVINRTQNDTIFSQEGQMINYVSQTSNDTHNGNNAVRDSSMTFAPTYNITVTGSSQEETALNFRQVIEDTMNEMMSRMERVSFA